MLRFLLAFILIIAVLPVSAQNDPLKLEWSETWNFESDLIPIGVQVDHWNNIYSAATIYSAANSNILLLKYGSNKTLLWAKEFDNNDNELVSDMVVRGYAIYLVGKANDLLLLLKYNSDGELLWAKYASVKTKGLPSLDVDAKYVHVVLGNWMIRYDKMNGEVSETYKLEEDKNKIMFDFINVYGNNVYLAGQSATKLEIVLQKRDLNGNMLWNITRESQSIEGARHISLYGGMLYVTGIEGTVIIDNGRMRGVADLLLVKYDKSGNLIWERTWGTNSTLEWGFSDRAYRNKLYVVGLTSSGTDINGTSTILQSYDLDGNLQWSTVRNEINRGVGIDVKDNTVFLVGSHENDVLIQEYTKKG